MDLIHSPHLAGPEAKAIDAAIEVVPDYPRHGIMFRNLMPVLAVPWMFHHIVEALCGPYEQVRPDVVVGMEARGFIFAAAMAARLGVGFVPVRKAGSKLPGKKDTEIYALEYGNAAVEMQEGAIKPGMKVVIVDDLLATGGTAAAGARLVRRQGGNIISYDFVIELMNFGAHKVLVPEPIVDSPTRGIHALFTY